MRVIKKTAISAHRYHDISCGHRVVGHEGKCRHLHGHNYRVHFFCQAEDRLDALGRVIDFGVIKAKLCMWLEDNWDHKFIHLATDPMIISMCSESVDGFNMSSQDFIDFSESFVPVIFNPTAENMAYYLLNNIGPLQLKGTGVILTKVIMEETRKCAVTVELKD